MDREIEDSSRSIETQEEWQLISNQSLSSSFDFFVDTRDDWGYLLLAQTSESFLRNASERIRNNPLKQSVERQTLDLPSIQILTWNSPFDEWEDPLDGIELWTVLGKSHSLEPSLSEERLHLCGQMNGRIV